MSALRHTDGTSGVDVAVAVPGIRLHAARFALLWERLWPALWPALFIAGLFVLIALFDLLPLLPGWLHLASLALFAAAFLACAFRAAVGLQLPDRAAAIRRLERDSGFVHRPLGTLADRLAGGRDDPQAAALWAAHRRRLAAQLDRLRLAAPRAGLARRDPYGLRVALALLLIVGAVVARDGGWQSLVRAVTPSIDAQAGLPPSFDVWITPPAYTGAAPIFLSADGATATEAATLNVPEGSVVLAQVHNGRGIPILYVGAQSAAFVEIDAATFRAESKILTGDRIAIEQNDSPLAVWAMTVVPDHAPTIAFAKTPQRTERAALRLEYDARDDYGLALARAVIHRADSGGGPAAPIELALPLPAAMPREAQAASYHDLTPHPWAGLPVRITLEATDALGQSATGETVDIVLPERIFNHPVARAIIEQRKRLTLAPQAREPVARALRDIASVPGDYAGDFVVALALRVAQRRLLFSRDATAVTEVQALLWETALRLEDGNLAVAERELRAAQQALQDALANDASDEEIERLMDELQRALDNFLAALAENMQRNQAAGDQELQPLDPNSELLQREDLQRLLDQAREMARAGAREAARNMLSQLQEMLENLRANPMAGRPSSQAAQAMQMLRDMEGLAQRQQELLDRNFRQSQQSQPGDEAPDTSESAADQEALRRQLGDIMRRFGEMSGSIPRSLGRAEREMRGAVEAFEQGQPGAAIDPQSRALSELQQGAREMLEQMQQAYGQQQAPGEGDDRFGQSRDPLGRAESGRGMMDTGDVEIPEQADVQRAREILDELRRRAGERVRPKMELDYIDRLLRRF